MCSVVECDSWRRGAQRFKLPEDPERRLEWVRFVLEVNGERLKESDWTEISICCEHFTEDWLQSPAAADAEVQLKPGAVPSQMEGSTEKWTDSEVRELLDLYGCREIQRDGTSRNLKVFATISQQLAVVGVYRTVKQCREKIKKLKQDYKKVKEQNIRSGYQRKTNKWYEKMDAIFGHRPEFSGFPMADVSTATESTEIPETEDLYSVANTLKTEETAPEESEEGFLNDAPLAGGMFTDCSTSSSPCPPSNCASPPCPSANGSMPSTSNTSQPSTALPRPGRKRKREESGLQRLVKQLLQKDEEDRRISQNTMNQLLAMLKEQDTREAEDRERQRAEAAEERRRQDAFHKLLSMLLLRLSETSQQPTHPTLD